MKILYTSFFLFLCLSLDVFSQCIVVNTPPNPGICLVTIDSLNHNVVVWEKPVTEKIKSFNIYKETDTTTNTFSLIGNVPYDSLSVYTETGSNTNLASTRFKISMIDSCNDESILSAPHKTLLITPKPGLLPGHVKCSWETYVGLAFSTFYVYRGVSRDSMTLIATKSSTSFAWNDTATSVTLNNDSVFYYVEVVPALPCVATRENTNYNSAKSNTAGIAKGELVTGIRNSPKLDLLEIYPNPNNGIFNIGLGRTNLKNNNEIKISITDILGRKTKELRIVNPANGLFPIDLSKEPQGIYHVLITSGDHQFSKTIQVSNY